MRFLPERKESASLAAVKWARALTLWRESKPTGRTKVDHFAKAVLLDLAHRAKVDPDRSGAIICFPSCQTVADMLGVSKDSVDRALHRLREAKLIESEFRYDKRGKRTSNTYILKVGTMPQTAAKSDISLSRSQRSTKPLPAVDYAAGSGGTYEGSSEGSSEEERKSSSAAISERGQPTSKELPIKQAGSREPADQFEAHCRAAIIELGNALKEAGHPSAGREILRAAYNRWGQDVACGGAYRLAYRLERGMAVRSPAGLLNKICGDLKDRSYKPDRSILDDIRPDGSYFGHYRWCSIYEYDPAEDAPKRHGDDPSHPDYAPLW